MAGALYGYFVTYIYPQFVFDPLSDLEMVLIVFTGGIGTVVGPVLGAFLIEPAHEYFAFTYGASGLYLVLYGVLFLIIILLLPQGITPTLQSRLSSWRARRRAGPAQVGSPARDEDESAARKVARR
jgi:branched-chain amino acid transport system permease protein